MSDYVEPGAPEPDGTVPVTHGDHGGFATPEVATGGVLVTCPVCGAQSYWPVTGGADAEKVDVLAEITTAAIAASAAIAAGDLPEAKGAGAMKAGG